MKRSHFTFAALLILLPLLTGSRLSAQSTSLPMSHWAYDAVERWEIRGLCRGVFNATRPFTRIEMAGYLAQVLQALEARPEQFSRTDREQLRYLIVEFEEELGAEREAGWQPRLERLFGYPIFRHFSRTFYTNQRNLLTIQRDDFNFFLDPVLGISREEFPGGDGHKLSRLRSSNGLLFRGNLGPNVGFYFNLTDNHVRDDRFDADNPPPEVIEESGWPYLQPSGSGTFDFDDNVAFITFSSKYFYLLYGREYNQWGVGHNGNLMLSSNAQLYDQIKLVVRYRRFKFTHLTASLEYIDPALRASIKDQNPVDVFWAGNRLELNMGRGVQLGLSEAIIYGNRSLEPGYLNPLTFFKSLEHFYGDRDNGSLGLDVEWAPVPGVKLFGEWFIDDITTTKLGSRFYGNKFGWQGGLYLVNPLSLRDIDLLVEYSRLKPYVYSHSFRDYNKYKHYDALLGHFIGPNSDDLLVRLRRRFGKFAELSLFYEAYRHGANPPDRNVGGDPDLAFRPGDNRNPVFLDGERAKQHSLGGTIRYELLRNLTGELAYRQIRLQSGKWMPVVSFRFSLNFGQKDESFRHIFPASH